MEKETILMDFISMWNWFILSFILLLASLFSLVLPLTITTQIVLFFAFMFGFGYCTYKSQQRKKRILLMQNAEEYEEEDNTEENEE